MEIRLVRVSWSTKKKKRETRVECCENVFFQVEARIRLGGNIQWYSIFKWPDFDDFPPRINVGCRENRIIRYRFWTPHHLSAFWGVAVKLLNFNEKFFLAILLCQLSSPLWLTHPLIPFYSGEKHLGSEREIHAIPQFTTLQTTSARPIIKMRIFFLFNIPNHFFTRRICSLSRRRQRSTMREHTARRKLEFKRQPATCNKLFAFRFAIPCKKFQWKESHKKTLLQFYEVSVLKSFITPPSSHHDERAWNEHDDEGGVWLLHSSK